MKYNNNCGNMQEALEVSVRIHGCAARTGESQSMYQLYRMYHLCHLFYLYLTRSILIMTRFREERSRKEDAEGVDRRPRGCILV